MKMCPYLLLPFAFMLLLTAHECTIHDITKFINDGTEVLKGQLAAVNPLSEQLADFNTRWNQRTSEIQFKGVDNGQVTWGERCDFPGTEIRQFPSTSEECGQLCIAEERCTHFSWSSNKGFPSLFPQAQFVREKRTKGWEIGKKKKGKGGFSPDSVWKIPGNLFNNNICYLKTAQNSMASSSPQEGICGWVTSRVARKVGSSIGVESTGAMGLEPPRGTDQIYRNLWTSSTLSPLRDVMGSTLGENEKSTPMGSSAAIPFSRMGFLALFAFVMGIYFITEWP